MEISYTHMPPQTWLDLICTHQEQGQAIVQSSEFDDAVIAQDLPKGITCDIVWMQEVTKEMNYAITLLPPSNWWSLTAK